MIHKKTGAIHLDDGVVFPLTLTRDEFEGSALSQRAKLLATREPWAAYHLASVQLSARRARLSLYFERRRLDHIILSCLLSGDPVSWDTWSKEWEMRRKDLHDQLLREWLGEPPHDFNWGRAMSVYDQQTAESIILIKYMPTARFWDSLDEGHGQ